MDGPLFRIQLVQVKFMVCALRQGLEKIVHGLRWGGGRGEVVLLCKRELVDICETEMVWI